MKSNNNNAKEDFSHLPDDYDRRIVSFTLYILFFANLFVNIDMGILPAGSTKIKDELKLNMSQYGSLGSVVYFGQTIGSAIATGILANLSPKYILMVCLTLNIAALLVFCFTDIFALLVVSRTATGIF